MPCRGDYMEPTAGERKETAKLRKEIEELGDKLTYSCDVLREYLLGNAELELTLPHLNFDAHSAYVGKRMRNDKLYVKVPVETMAQVNQLVDDYQELNNLATRMEKPNKKELARIEKAQIKHREADLWRLARTFVEKADRERLMKVLSADNTKPLEPQLGFSPDEF